MAASPLVPLPDQLLSVSDKVVIVTGASSGLGATFARGLHAAGALVVAAARRADRVDALVAELGADRVVGVVADVTVPADRARIVAAALERWGRVDALVNNAGTLLDARPDAEDEVIDDFVAVLTTNLTALFAMCQEVVGAMTAAGGGSIVNVGSIYGEVAATGGASYVASKGGVHALTRELAVQWGPKRIRVNVLAPGWFESELTRHIFGTEAGERMLRRTTALGRGGRAHELLGALQFFCSDASTYCTGQVLAVDGGYLAR